MFGPLQWQENLQETTMLKPGDTLPSETIRIEAKIDEGAFGVVYRA